MRYIVVRDSAGDELGSIVVDADSVTLSKAIEHDVWRRQTVALNRELDHLAALQSGEVVFNAQGVWLSDGTPVSPEMLP